MKKLICVALLMTGCSDSAELSAMKAALEDGSEEVTAKQDESLTILRDNTTALAAIKSQVESLGGELLETRRAVGTMEATLSSPKPNSQEVIKSALEPQEPERDPNITPSISVSAPAVRLQFYTQDFCRDCTIQQPKAEAAAEELGISLEVFDLKEHDDAFEQAKITVTPTTVIVIDDAIRVRFVGVVSAAIIVERAKSEISGTNAVVSRPQITNPVVSQTDLVSIHNRLHGGGNWTWPGDLETHLRVSHGYGTKSQPVQLVSRGTSCPNGNCPTPRSMRMRWSR
jgi:hypothetical protein